MTRQTLTVSPRTETGKGPNRRLRSAGTVPAVVYTKGKSPVSVQADPKAVVAVLNGPYGKNAAVNLKVEGEADSRLALIQNYTVHPFKRTLEHIDFWEITPETVLTISVPFAGDGKSEAEKQGGRVRFTRDDILVRCKPAHVPTKITFYMAALSAADHNITVSQIPMPEGVTAHFKHDYSLIQVFLPKVVAVADDGKAKKDDKKKGAAKAPAKKK
jgi:large subunit ribosomal protein L25